MEKKRISIFVAGQRFNILSDEEEKYVIDVAAKVDARITSLSISQNMTRERAAVLTALDFADDNEKDKRAIAEIKEQIKDYVTEIARLSEENTAMDADKDQLDRTVAALKEAQDTVAADEKEIKELHVENDRLKSEIADLKEAQDTAAADEKEIEALKAQIRALKEQMELVQMEKAPEPQPSEEAPAPVNEIQITAEDDLFFEEEAPVIKPQPPKEKKNRHDHSHVNPYKQQFMQKQKDQKGYTQQRQYSLFDTDE
jgi:chromosome segregation ATPase